jgi:hypothetical protein
MQHIVPDLTSVTPLSTLLNRAGLGSSFRDACREARDYLKFYDWVSAIEDEYLGFAAEGIIYIFLFKIGSERPDVDPWLWVIVGDIPPAYITCEVAKVPFEALDGYLGAMQEWVEAARSGKSAAKMIPVNVPANPENAEMLNRRLKFLDRKIMPMLKSEGEF